MKECEKQFPNVVNESRCYLFYTTLNIVVEQKLKPLLDKDFSTTKYLKRQEQKQLTIRVCICRTYLLTARYAQWHVGQQQSFSTTVCWGPFSGLFPKSTSCLSANLPQFNARWCGVVEFRLNEMCESLWFKFRYIYIYMKWHLFFLFVSFFDFSCG